MIKFRLPIALAAAIATANLVLSASPTQAADRNGLCEDGEFCLFWGNNLYGAVGDYRYGTNDFAADHLKAICCTWRPGMGERVKNNAASAWNKHHYYTARVHYNENQTGPYDDVAPDSWRNLYYTHNDNASWHWR